MCATIERKSYSECIKTHTEVCRPPPLYTHTTHTHYYTTTHHNIMCVCCVCIYCVSLYNNVCVYNVIEVLCLGSLSVPILLCIVLGSSLVPSFCLSPSLSLLSFLLLPLLLLLLLLDVLPPPSEGLEIWKSR